MYGYRFFMSDVGSDRGKVKQLPLPGLHFLGQTPYKDEDYTPLIPVIGSYCPRPATKDLQYEGRRQESTLHLLCPVLVTSWRISYLFEVVDPGVDRLAHDGC
jgi:hypothetical protein